MTHSKASSKTNKRETGNKSRHGVGFKDQGNEEVERIKEADSLRWKLTRKRKLKEWESEEENSPMSSEDEMEGEISALPSRLEIERYKLKLQNSKETKKKNKKTTTSSNPEV
eukprot:Gregarina_sp_Poly_1__3682@NODE_2087_length_2704_cov_43_003034_g1347_i0_p5_GENE_NODE_2087_length_2704_cov_43_003034_g1347_i0NODE_2087_length_2704_cov_43_003034_g1347_i0_p5_ORF_typecomplete_len112_score26_12_NODE_2087_length_2704_cov_43_003034_g1347_i013821717